MSCMYMCSMVIYLCVLSFLKTLLVLNKKGDVAQLANALCQLRGRKQHNMVRIPLLPTFYQTYALRQGTLPELSSGMDVT